MKKNKNKTLQDESVCNACRFRSFFSFLFLFLPRNNRIHPNNGNNAGGWGKLSPLPGQMVMNFFAKKTIKNRKIKCSDPEQKLLQNSRDTHVYIGHVLGADTPFVGNWWRGVVLLTQSSKVAAHALVDPPQRWRGGRRGRADALVVRHQL